MKTVSPSAYAQLPQVEPPAGYIFVIRDIDSDSYRIDGTAHPAPYIERLLNEKKRNFGIELVSILETEDLVATEAELFALYHARLSSDWLELDPYQLEALRRSVLQIDAHASWYLTPQPAPNAEQEAAAAQTSRYEMLANSYVHGPNRSQWKRRRPRPPLTERRYGARALRRNRPAPRYTVEYFEERMTFGDKATEFIEDIFVNHPGKVICVILLLMLIGLFVIGPMPRY